jgi:hypothetical protein
MGFDRRPLGLPIVFEKATIGVVIVVESPGDEGLARGHQNKALLVLGDLNPRHLAGMSQEV